VKAVPDLIARFVRQPFVPVALDTDTGSGELGATRVVVAVLAALASTGQVAAARVAYALEHYGTGHYETGHYGTGHYETEDPELRVAPVDPAVTSPSSMQDSDPSTKRSTDTWRYV